MHAYVYTCIHTYVDIEIFYTTVVTSVLTVPTTPRNAAQHIDSLTHRCYHRPPRAECLCLNPARLLDPFRRPELLCQRGSELLLFLLLFLSLSFLSLLLVLFVLIIASLLNTAIITTIPLTLRTAELHSACAPGRYSIISC